MSSQSLLQKQILFPDEVILRTDHFTVAQDWEVPIKGFYIIGSIQTRRSIIDFNDNEIIELARLQKLIRECMKTLLGILDVYFFQNEDSDHGFHIWIFPRHPWMDKIAGRKIQSVRPIMEHAVKHVTEEVLDEIRTANNRMRKYLEHLPVEDYLQHDLLGGHFQVLNFGNL
jgi:diadenosine tetraphosphate (Ap4A) HIT family hydrolase